MEDRTLESGNGGERPQFPPLARQESYNLSNLDEAQSHLGNINSKPSNGMHFDELLKNVISVEEGQLLQNPSSSSLPASFFLGNFNLNGALSRKTADEMWKEIAHHEHVNTVVANESLQQRLSTIGETPVTPEHFLVRAGVINIGNQPSLMNASQPIMAIDPTGVVSQQTDWLQFQMAAVQQQMTMLDSNLKVRESVYENSAVNFDYSENHIGMSMPMPAISASSCESHATAVRKRHFSDEIKERTIERRQKRMIKNRESAARSRARKQAYTNQLEHEVFQLGKVNSWLKKQKEVERILASNPISMPKYQLRRTSSAPY
ncbi:ABSCISIC ACID-INSENSITIVE 5-like protein 3 [Prunus yedoensis var. nudiflora]|uniref:ABSCISIC ACID-INSENSITIVE 5-like protein 3 n=1 Tax=Prunus yedoensis var. nudiflora TaxID=2094558 RepID=A0A314V2M1_PRUYE|nr:ABSCISIC ACID-INSENSITIVE 5-like protein 3 [Prunus yedoensis var. nudiflora]